MLSITNRSPARPAAPMASIVATMNPAFLPGDVSAALWILSGTVVFVVVATVFLLRKRHYRKYAMSRAEEQALWERLEQVAKERVATSSRKLVKDLSTYRREAETGQTSRAPAEDARSVNALFQTLHEDRPSGSGASAGSQDSRGRSFTQQQDLSGPPMMDLPPHMEATLHPGQISPPKTVDTPGLPFTPISAQYPFSALGQSKPLQGPQPGFSTPMGGGPQNLSSAVRLDATSRLEADLDWARPRATEPPRQTPSFIRRARLEKQARHYHRVSRQVALAKLLMHAPDEDLQRIGVETADRLEKGLHAERAKKTRRRRALRK